MAVGAAIIPEEIMPVHTKKYILIRIKLKFYF